VYEAKVVFDAKNQSINDKMIDIQLYQYFGNDPYFDKMAIAETIMGKDKARRWKATPEQVQRNIQMMQQMQGAQQGEAGQTRAEQALMGGAAHNAGNA
jgi:hypothetical protein